MFTFFFIGVATFQLVFIAYQYAVLKRNEFLYYFLYVLLITLFVLATLMPEKNPFQVLVTDECPYLLGRVNVVLAFAMYFNFGRLFTNSKVLYPFFDHIIRITIYVIYSMTVIDIILQLLGYSYQSIDRYFQYTSLALAAVTIYAVIYMITRKQVLTTILVIGSFFLMFFASIGLIKSLFITHQPVGYSENVTLIEIGIVFEFLFLTYGLIYKTRMIEKENIRLIVQQQEEIDKERQRIITDLHDDIGSTLSSISILSELAEKNYLQHPVQSRDMMHKISSQTKELMQGIEDIIWSLKPQSADQISFSKRIQQYAQELLTGKQIAFEFHGNSVADNIRMQQSVKRSLLLIIKEAVNNISKYSEAVKAIVSIEISNDLLIICIKDDGIGFHTANKKNGNGLTNMQKRCEALRGTFNIHSTPNTGTEICCTIPIANIRHTD